MGLISITGLVPQQEKEVLDLKENYARIVAHPDALISAADDAKDHASNNGYSIRWLEYRETATDTVPLHPAPGQLPAEIRSLTPRDLKTLSSETFAETVIASAVSEGMDPRDVLKSFGKNAAYIDDGSKIGGGGHEPNHLKYIAVLDPRTHEMTAYKVLLVERDMHDKGMQNPNGSHADPNGFSAVAAVKLKLSPEDSRPERFRSAREFMEAHHWNLEGQEKAPEVRTLYGGFQINLENWSLPGRLDRGELSKQLSRVLDFNEALKNKMIEDNLPTTTTVSFAAHSLAAASAPVARFYWENNPDLKAHGQAGHVTILEPVAQTETLRQAAFLIATEKSIAARQDASNHGRSEWHKTDVETETRNLLKDTDVVMNGHSSNLLHNFQVYRSAENGKIAGSRMFEISFDNTEIAKLDAAVDSLKTAGSAGFQSTSVATGAAIPVEVAAGLMKLGRHFIMGMGQQMINAPELVEIRHPNFATPQQIAEQPRNEHEKKVIDRAIRDASYLIASITANNEKDGFPWGKENDFRKTARDIGQSLGVAQPAVDATVEAANVPDRVKSDETRFARK